MIFMYHPGLPPTVNHAYINLPRGGRTLSKEGQKYKNEMIMHFSRNYRRELMLFKKDVPYLIVMTFYFDAIENEGWATRKAKSRYKKFDATNRPKLLEDVLKDAAGIDDSQNLDVYLRKRPTVMCPHMAKPGEEHNIEHVDLMIWDLEKEGNPFDGVLRFQP